MNELNTDMILVNLETLMKLTGYGRRRAMTLAELAHARVYLGHSLRFSVEKINEFIRKETI